MDPIIGIDLGTSNTVVAFAENGAAKVLADEAGYKIHPSVVSFHPNGGVIVGAAAKQRKVIDPHNTIYSVKRLIGRTWDSPEVQTAVGRVPYTIKQGEKNLPLIVTRGGEFAVPEISAIVLDHARNVAAARLERDVTRAVVTVPASFNEAQRSATATAGAIAGLTVVRVLNEPTAAALAYGHSRNLREIIAVYDFGGGTFDITILKLEDQVYEVLGTAGDTFLGGDDLDERLVDKMVAKFLAENRIDLRDNEVSMMRLRAVAEQTKIELSRRSRAVVRIDEIAYGAKGAPLNLQIEITRDEMISSVSDIIDRTFPVCQEALALAGIGVGQIADVILVGGTTKIPYVRDQVSKFFERAPRTDVSPEDAVAAGAALQATSLEKLLARPRTSSKEVPIVRPTTETTATDLPSREEPTQTDAGLQPARGKRETAGYPERRPTAKTDTSYSVQRGVARETLDEKTGSGPPPAAPAIGRLTKNMTPVAGMPAVTRTTGSQPVVPPGRTTGAMPPPIPGSRSARVQTQPLPTVTRIGPAAAPTFEGEEETRPRPPSNPPPIRKPWSDPDADSARTNDSMRRSGPAEPTVMVAPALDLGIPPAKEPEEDDDDFDQGPGVAADPSAASTTKGLTPARATVPAPVVAPPPIRYITPPAYLDPPVVASTVAAMSTMPSPSMSMTTSTSTSTPTYVPPPMQRMPEPPRAAPTVLEVTPRSFGIGTVAGYCEELIRRNARVPTEMKRVFSTSRDEQEHVRIVICQGESRRIDNNTVIGDLVLAGLPKRPRGETRIEVTFSLDASGILQVHARDEQTGKEQRAALSIAGNVQDVAASRERVAGLRR